MHRNHKNIGVKTKTTSQWFNLPLGYKLLHFLLDNRMMNQSNLNVKLVKIMEQWRLGPKVDIVAFNHIKHKHIGSNVSPLI